MSERTQTAHVLWRTIFFSSSLLKLTPLCERKTFLVLSFVFSPNVLSLSHRQTFQKRPNGRKLKCLLKQRKEFARAQVAWLRMSALPAATRTRSDFDSNISSLRYIKPNLNTTLVQLGSKLFKVHELKLSLLVVLLKPQQKFQNKSWSIQPQKEINWRKIT